MSMRTRDNEAGFTMIMTMIGLALMAVLVLVAVTAVNGDIHITGHDANRKRAYEAAKAGIDDYAYHLHIDNGYWAKCTKVGEADPVNQQGHTEKRRGVPGVTGAKYAIELIPATGHSECDATNITTATVSMLESLGAMKGTFRVRSTGYAGDSQVSITATFKPASFLDYVYFTQFETSDPVTYGPDEKLIEGAEKQCAKTLYEKRNNTEILAGSGRYCKVISFVDGDELKGPVHTNDAFVICGEPVFGRDASDSIEVSSPPQGWYSTKSVPNSGSKCSGSPVFKGTYRTNAATLVPPATNQQLASIAEPGYRFKGQVHICLNGSSMTVATEGTPGDDCASGTVKPFPTNGVVYVENASVACSGAYTPYEVTYPATSECGNVFVHGTYSKPLTIAASNNIIIDKSVTNTSEEGILGLIANNFIRIYHPFENVTNKYGQTECVNAPGYVKDIQIDAAILAINHSFIVDNYECGASLGTLKVVGAISQKFRGAVGTTGGTGYIKSYNYDDRLHTIAPPSFIQPVQSDWVIGRETIG